jgi:hypothetical protein
MVNLNVRVSLADLVSLYGGGYEFLAGTYIRNREAASDD